MVDLVTGGAGFIGSNFVDHLIDEGRQVRVLDSFVVGRRANLQQHHGNARLEVLEADISDKAAVDTACAGAQRLFHLASRADIEWLASNGGYGKREVNPYHLTRAIEAAGMANPHRQLTLAGARLYVVVVRNHDIWTRERVQAASTEVLAKAVGR